MLKCDTASLNSCKMGVLVFLVYSMIGQLYAGLTIDLNTTECGKDYSLSVHRNITIEHVGSEVLQDDECFLEFFTKSNEEYICVSGQEMRLDCDTELEYHQSYIKYTWSGDVEMSCGTERLEEWCADIYQDFFILIRKSPKVTSDVIRLNVYVKDAGKPHANKTSMVIYTILPIIAVAIVALFIMYCVKRRRSRYSESEYRADTIAMQTGYQPTPQADYAGQQGHNGQPMLSAYPMGEQHPPATPAVPPPSYNRAVGEGR